MLDEALKAFLDALMRGQHRRDLFLFENRIVLNLFKLELADSANARGLCPVVRMTDNTVHFDCGSIAYLRVGHPYVDREAAGMELNAIHGIQTLIPHDRYNEMASILRSRVRP